MSEMSHSLTVLLCDALASQQRSGVMAKRSMGKSVCSPTTPSICDGSTGDVWARTPALARMTDRLGHPDAATTTHTSASFDQEPSQQSLALLGRIDSTRMRPSADPVMIRSSSYLTIASTLEGWPGKRSLQSFQNLESKETRIRAWRAGRGGQPSLANGAGKTSAVRREQHLIDSVNEPSKEPRFKSLPV